MEISATDRPPEFPALVPELLVRSLDTSLAFWCELCDFGLLYTRRDEGFAYLTRRGAHLMLEEAGVGRNWRTGSLDHPLGRGVNFQISVQSITPIVAALDDAHWPLFMRPEERSYRTGDSSVDVAQFLVQDPDGYLIRFQARSGGDADRP